MLLMIPHYQARAGIQHKYFFFKKAGERVLNGWTLHVLALKMIFIDEIFWWLTTEIVYLSYLPYIFKIWAIFW